MFYADWVRAIAITLVIFVHCLVNSADASDLNYDENPTMKQKEDGILKSLLQIGIPMFFYISGIGASFFDTEKNHYGIFIGNKIVRILIPFTIAIFAFLIPRLYFGQQYEDFTRNDNEIQNNYWEYMKASLPTIYLKLSWLWYLPALFIDFIICYPLLRWSVRRSKGIPFDSLTDTGIILLQMATLALWASVNYYLVPTYGYNLKLLIPAIGILSAVFFCFYSLQLTINVNNGHHMAILIKLIGPIGSILMNMYKV